MARLPRLYLPGCSHHIIQRGKNREPSFFGDSDYKGKIKDTDPIDSGRQWIVECHSLSVTFVRPVYAYITA